MTTSTPNRNRDQRDAIPELTTTRLGGGRSARVIAVAVGALLIGTIYVGVSGHQAQPPAPVPPAPLARSTAETPRSDAPVVAADASPNVPAQSPVDSNAIQAIRANPAAPVRYQYLGARLSVRGQSLLAVMDPVADNEYRVAYRIPSDLVSAVVTLNISAVMDTVSHDDFDALGQWSFPLDVAGSRGPAPISVLDARQPPNGRPPANPTFGALSRDGFHVTATAENTGGARLLTIDVLVGSDDAGGTVAPGFYPNEDYQADAALGNTSYSGGSATETLPGHVRGEILMPLQLGSDHFTVELSAIPMSDPLIGRVFFANYAVQAPTLAEHAVVTESIVAPSPEVAGFPQVKANGYTIRLLSTFDGANRAVFWDLQINATPDAPPTTR